MLGKAFEILEGWGKVIVKDEATESLALARASICSSCPKIVRDEFILVFVNDAIEEIAGFKCGECGCPLSPKVRSQYSECPLGKWETNG